MDKLDEIFKMQKELDGYITASRNLDYSLSEWIQKRSLALINEVCELINEVNYKWWKNPKQINTSNLKEELSDILHFFVGMCIDVGVDADELYNTYINKNNENHNRQNGLSAKTGYEITKK